MKRTDQPAREQNIAAIVEYCESGIKEKARWLGIEIEHTLVYTDGTPVSYSDEHGAKWILEQLLDDFPEPMLDDDEELIGAVGKNKTVTLEPAAQLELSAGPFRNMSDARKCIDNFESRVTDLVSPFGIELLTPGYNPTSRAIDLELIPKQRYAFMNEYLGAISMFGICMMRGSAATQIAIDYTSVEDCLRKLRLASACVPVLSLICDNSPIFELEIRPHQLMRTEIWEKCDPDRCGIIPGVMRSDFTLSDYAEYVLDVPAIYEGSWADAHLTDKTFGEIFADKVMDTEEIEHALSLLFNDVRLKKYIEIRPADAMPAEYVVAYAALIKGLFYNEASLNALDDIFYGVSETDIAEAKRSLMENGYAGVIYGRPAPAMADKLISIASAALEDEDLVAMAPISDLIAKKTTLACIVEKELTS